MTGRSYLSTGRQKLGGITGEAVASATGRDWCEWLDFLDALDAREMTHREIVVLVAGKGGLSNGWWQQMVTVGYEQARGLRIVGQTADAGYQIGVQKTLPIPQDLAWDLLVTGPGRNLWLGDHRPFNLQKGEEYVTCEGVSGQVRSVAPGQRLRLTWSHPDLARPSTLQLMLVGSGEKTSIRFHQERLSSPDERERMRQHWREVLRKLLELL